MLALLGLAFALQLPVRVETFLRDTVDFSGRDLRDMAEGAALVKKVEGRTDEEIALIGVVRVPMPASRVVDRLRDLTTVPRSRAAMQAGRFSVPPVSSDLATFVVPPEDLSLLRSCRPGKCVIKLPSSLIDSLSRIDWQAAAADTLATAIWRRWLLDYVRDYRQRGNDAETPLALHTGFHELLGESPYLFAFVPALHHYLDEFPARPLPGAEDALYWWSTENVGLRPITTLSHATVNRPDSGTGVHALVAIKLIYASHYFHAGLSVIAVIDDPSRDGAGAYVISLERSLFDKRLGGLVRRSAESRLQADLRGRLEAMRRQTP